MTLAARLVASGIRDIGRRRWLLAYALFYIVLTDALFRFGGTGARAVLTTPIATRIFRARDSMQRAEIVQSIVVENGGRLDVCPDMLIAHGGARYSQAIRLEVLAGGELFFTEMLAPGRTASGEVFA